MYRIFIVIFILSVSFYLYKDYTKIMELETAHEEWAKIIKVEERHMGIPKVGGSYLNWLVTVSLNNGRTAKVSVIYSPVPKIGDCLPVTVGIFATGGILATLNFELWQYDTSSSRVAPCKGLIP